MNLYRIRSFQITNLWGYKNIDLTFFSDVTILIGENGTGKTTILSILRGILTADPSLLSFDFTDATVELAAFSDASTKTITVSRREDDLVFQFCDKEFLLRPISPSTSEQMWPSLLYSSKPERNDLKHALRSFMNLVWLPVGRRLPMQEETNLYIGTVPKRSQNLESVDQRLAELLKELVDYRLRLNSSVSEQYRNFERNVLEAILYSADYDSVGALKNERMPSQDDRDELVGVFDEVGILDSEMKNRIRRHFTEAKKSLTKLQKDRDWDIDDLVVIPLIRRTQSLVAWARTLRAERDELFAPLQSYQAIVNDFLRNKRAVVREDGRLFLTYTIADRPGHFSVDHLSSGEKQILILLTAALLREATPVVYLADEPELSLHVSWQEKLLRSLVELGGTIQVVVATHSPDIVGSFHDNIVKLSHE